MALRRKWKSGDPCLVHHVDPSIVVVEKRAGILTQATEKNERNTLIHHVRRFLRGRGSTEIFPVHRLDRVVSGLLVYARRPDAQAALIEQFKVHDVQRLYTAAVHGVLDADEGTFDSWLVTNHRSLRVFSGEEGQRGTRHAVTHWRVRERFADATLVEVALETGIRNQIRVHFAEAGHPLLGERKYAEDPGLQKTHRIFLHAEFLGFDHPYTGRYVRYEAPLPPDLEKWKKKLGPHRDV
ncbi:MAG: pseudouridine synthase [Deltaproteobacteria bacterium]